MCLVCNAGYAATGMIILASSSGMPHVATLANAKVDNEIVSSQLLAIEQLPQAVAAVKVPQVKDPAWLVQQNAAEAAARAAQKSATKNVTYSVTTRGTVRANLVEFRSQANATLNDPRGWARMGVSFQEVESGGMFILVLSEASQLPSFSPGCGTEYSCRAGKYVVINQDRWLGATSSWNQAGGTLRDYRHMVVNHETGHWLGHDHAQCGGAGQSAPVMQQQSISLQGCKFNPWPIDSELWSTQLGIRRS